MLFSQRIGKTQVKSIIQVDSMDSDLRNSLWNNTYLIYWRLLANERYIDFNDDDFGTFLRTIWIKYFRNRIDEIPEEYYSYFKLIKEYFFKSKWYEVYDFIEFIPNNYKPYTPNNLNNEFIQLCNLTLEKELSQFRFINNRLTSITSKIEIESIEESLEVDDKYNSVTIHLTRALELFSDRKTPDYRNSIKESISAIESFCSILTQDSQSTLGKLLSIIEKKYQIHPSLRNSLSSLYGYTSDADGIRHALMEQSTVNQEDAKFILVVCSAFINYLKQKEINT